MKKFLVLSLFLSATFLYAAELGNPAPPFTLVDQHKTKPSLSDEKGKVVLINFWASWCAPCQQELPELDRLAMDYKGKKVKIIAINVDEDRGAARTLLAKLQLKSTRMEILWDTKSKVVSTYNIDSMPSSFIVDPHGTIRFIHVGFHSQDPSTWRQEIDSLFTSKP